MHSVALTRIAAVSTAWLALAASAWSQTPRPVPQLAPEPSASTPNTTPTNSSMDGELFYQILLGELNAISSIGGSPGTSFSLILDAARKTNDDKLFKRAVDLAIQARAGEPALQAARAWQQAQPQNREAIIQVINIQLALGKLQDSAEPLRSLIQNTPTGERSAVIAQLPRFYSRASDKKAAAALVEQALAPVLTPDARPDNAAAAWTSIGRMRLAATDVPGAIDAVKRAQAIHAADTGSVWFALELMDPRQPEAESIVRSYLEQPNASADIRLAYARNLQEAQRYGDALPQLQRVTRERADNAEAWLLLGEIELSNNQLDAADSSYKKYIDLVQPRRNSDEKQRGLTAAYLALARIAEKRKDYSLAESWLAKVDSPAALVSTQSRRASILAKQGKLDDARALIAKLPERPGAEGAADRRMKTLAEVQLLKDHQQYQAAYDLLHAAVERAPQDHELIYQQASAAEKLERYGEMERLLRRAIDIRPDFAYAYNFLGYSLADRNVRLPEAKALLQKAIELAPGDPAITDSLGWVEFRLGNMAQALKLLEKAYQAFPNAEIGAHLAEVLWVTGQRERAIQIFKECMLLDAQDKVLLETIKRLRVRL